MPPIGTPIIILNPSSQNVTWTRNTPFPSLLNFQVNSNSSFAFISYTIVNENTSVEWIALTGDVDPADNSVLDPGTITPVLQNIDILTGNFYSTKIRVRQQNTERVHTINLTIAGEYSPIKTEKPNYSLVYNRITNTLSGDTTVNIVNNTNSENVTFETFGDLFLEKTAVTNFTLEEDPAFPFAVSPELPTIGSKIISGVLRNAVGTAVYTFSISIQVVNTNDITTDQQSLSFSLYRHLSESKTQVLKIINPTNLGFTISAPDFVNLSANSGSTTVDIDVETDNSAVLLAKEYTGNIVISYGSKNVTVPVIVKNIDFIDLKVGDYNFCLDDFILSVQRINDTGKFVKISLEIIISTANESFIVTPSYQIAYYNNKASTDVGKKIHNHFPVFENHLFSKNSQVDFNNQLIYSAAKVNIKIEELNANYEVVFTKTLQQIKMFPGKKPKMFPVFTNSKIRSRYSGSGYVFSYLSALVAPSDITQKPVSSNAFSPDQVQSVFFEDDDKLIDFGDYKNILEIEYLKMPKGDLKVLVQFINQNLVPEMAVFNGFYKIEEDFTHTYDDFETNPKKYDTKVIGKATLNTGFIFKEESKMITEIAKSKLAFVKIENEIYKCLPIPGKLEKVNSENNLVIFELEFLIVE